MDAEFRSMRRARQALTAAECEEVLRLTTSGVLSVSGDDGWPYGVPLSHTLHEGKLLFHCALSGHKLDALRRENRACFTVIESDRVVQPRFTTAYRSVVVFGRVSLLTSCTAPLLRAICGHLCPDMPAEAVEEELHSAGARTCVLVMQIDHMTGKRGLEFKGAGC